MRAAGLQVVTRQQTAEKYVRMGQNVEQDTDRKALSVVRELADGLSKSVYSSEGKIVIEQTRVILDLPALACKIKEAGGSAIKVAVTEFQKFRQAVIGIPLISLKDVPEDELRLQFRVFVERLAVMTGENSIEELKCKDAKELIKKFFHPGDDKFKGIEMIMQALATSAVKHSCESVLESFVSRYENHFDARRPTNEETANEEFEIACNGPNLANSDGVVCEAMDSYWRKKGSHWHFFRTSVLEKLNRYEGESEVLNRMIKTKNNLPFMN